MAGRIGDAIGEIVGAPPGTVSMHENVTTAEAVVLCVPPSDPGPAQASCASNTTFLRCSTSIAPTKRPGSRVEVVGGEPDLTMREERVLATIDSGTLLVALSHVLFRNSYVMDVRPIVEGAHAVGALVVLDTYQSAGIIPVEVGALLRRLRRGGLSEVAVWGPGQCVPLHAARTCCRRSSPASPVGWVTASRLRSTPARSSSAPDARRMMNGTPAIPAYHAAMAGLDIVRQVGVGSIREKSKRMTARLVEMAEARGFRTAVARDPERVAGTVAVDVPEGKLVARALKTRDFLDQTTASASGIRASPHLGNTFEELERLIAEMDRIVRTKDYDASQPFASLVT